MRHLLDDQQRAPGPAQHALSSGAKQQFAHEAGATRAEYQNVGVDGVSVVADLALHLSHHQMHIGRDAIAPLHLRSQGQGLAPHLVEQGVLQARCVTVEQMTQGIKGADIDHVLQ